MEAHVDGYNYEGVCICRILLEWNESERYDDIIKRGVGMVRKQFKAARYVVVDFGYSREVKLYEPRLVLVERNETE